MRRTTRDRLAGCSRLANRSSITRHSSGSSDKITSESSKTRGGIMRRLSRSDRAHRVGNRLALRPEQLDLPELRNDLLSRMPLPRHPQILQMAKSHTSRRTTFQRAGQPAILAIVAPQQRGRRAVTDEVLVKKLGKGYGRLGRGRNRRLSGEFLIIRFGRRLRLATKGQSLWHPGNLRLR